MRRRDVLSLLGGAAVSSWQGASRAQQSGLPVIGFLSARSPNDTLHLVAAFQNGLAEKGYVEGRSVLIEYRWALGDYDRLSSMAAELAARPVTVLVSTGGEPAALAAKAATSTVPIVFGTGGDPVQLGLADSYNRPGGNATGINFMTATLEPKRLGLVHELLPEVRVIGALVNPAFPQADAQVREFQDAARALRLEIQVLRANTDGDIEATRDVPVSGICDCRWPHELWDRRG
jgi:putative ABC transport system substrate-binding protein